jgi:manganese/zinc/iron transport system permease protein
VAALTFLRRATRLKDDAAMGVARSFMFGLGIVLISYAQNSVTEGSKAGLDSYILGKTAGMLAGDVAWIAGVSGVSLALVLLLFKELRLTSFDGDFARVQGWPAAVLELLQMGLVAVTTVVGLPAVGAVLVAAMLILPAATMRFWTEKLSTLLLGSMLVGGAIGAVGTMSSARYSWLPAGPIIILTGTCFFLVSMLVAPRRGLTARIVDDRRFRRELRASRLLRSLYLADEQTGGDRAWHDLLRVCDRWSGGARDATQAVALAERVGLIERQRANGGSEIRLTAEGRTAAAAQVRNERLWEAFVEENPDQAAAPVDPRELAAEDAIPPEMLARLERRLRAAGRLPTVASTDPRETQS